MSELRLRPLTGGALLLCGALVAGGLIPGFHSTVNDTDLAPSPISPTLGEPGTFTVLSRDGLVTIVANQAPRLKVFRQLAKTIGFGLVINDVDLGKATIQLESVGLEKAVLELLHATPLQMHYGFDPSLGAHYVAKVSIGDRKPLQQVALAKPKGSALVDIPAIPELFQQYEGLMDSHEDRQNGHEPTDLLESHVERHLRELDDNGYQLDSAYTDERTKAVRSFMPHGDGLNALVDVLATDPDPAVREAAVKQLSIGGTFGSTRALLDALNDSDPNVVFRAMEGLVRNGDRSVIPDVEATLWDHPNQYVRESGRNIAQAFDARSRMNLDLE